MLRRLSFVLPWRRWRSPVLLAGPGARRPGRTPSDDPAAQAQLRKEQTAAPPRTQAVSRRAKRARARDDSPLAVTIDTLTPSTIPAKGDGPGLRDRHQHRHRPLVDDQRLLVHLRRAADDARPARRGSGHARRTPWSASRITDERHYDTIDGARAGRPRDVQPQRRRAGCSRPTPRASTGSACTRSASAAGGPRPARRRPGPHLPADGAHPARPGQEATAVVIPLRHQLVVRRRRVARRPRRAGPRPSAQGGRLRSLVDFGASVRRPHRELGGRPGARRRRTSAGGRQPAPVARPPTSRPGRRTARTSASAATRRRAPPRPRSPPQTPTSSRRSRRATRRQPARPRRARPGRAGGRPGRAGLAGPAARGDAPRGPRSWRCRTATSTCPPRRAHDPQLYERAVTRAGTTLPGFDVTTTPVVSSPSGYLTAQAIRIAVAGHHDPGHRRDVRGPGPRGRRRPRATTWSSPRPAPATAARARASHDVDHRDAAAAAGRGRGAVPPAAAGRR